MDEEIIVDDSATVPKVKLECAVHSGGLGKRVLASLIDFGIMFILFLGLLNFAIEPLFNNIYHTEDISNQITEYRLESGLFIKNENILEKVAKENYILVSKNYYEDYCSLANQDKDHACGEFGVILYDVVMNEEAFQKYYQANLEKELTFKEEYQDDIETREMVESYVYEKAASDMMNYEPFASLITKSNRYVYFEIFIGLAISLIMLFLLIPICLSDGRTLGKLFLKLAVTDFYGYKVRKLQIIIRFLAYAFTGSALLILGFIWFPFMLLPFISFAIMMFSKKNSAIHDFCAATMVVDRDSSVIYLNRANHEEAALKEEEVKSRIEEKRKKV